MDHDKQGFLDAIALGLVGKRYETLDGAESPSDPRFDNETCRQLGTEVIDWLRKTM